MLAFSPHFVGGWGIYTLVVDPELFKIRILLKLESRNPVDITEALVFKLLFIGKDITLVARFFS